MGTKVLVAVTLTGVVLGATLIGGIWGARVLAGAYEYSPKELPPLAPLSLTTTVVASDGSPLGLLGAEDRQLAHFEELPRDLVDAVVATEDRTFWTNDGIDAHAMVRAFVRNADSGRIAQGGSTITQQLVKTRIDDPKHDLEAKIRQVVQARRLDQRMSKQQILTEYLNTVYFGQGAYGVKSAARRFFGKAVADLTLPESALLAGLISNPEGYNPWAQPDAASARRATVLSRMEDEGYVSRDDADAAREMPLPAGTPPRDLRPHNYLVDEVQKQLLQDPRLGETPEARLDRVLRGGLQVQTTFDPALQAAAERAVAEAKPQKGADWDGSLVAIDPATGAVRAMVGGAGFADSQYNIATQTPGRQPGSTWKIITLAAALEAGYSPEDLVDEGDPCSVARFGPLLQTVNAEPGSGIHTLRDATVHSVNCAYVRLSTSVGQDRVIDMAHRMGISQQRLQQILTLSLGTIEATPTEMATVAATLASGGVRHDPRFVERVVDASGTVLIDGPSAGTRAVAPEVAACATDVLRGVVTSGTGTKARLDAHDAAGKTGTTDQRADAWFVGYTPQLATAVWFGNRRGVVPGAGFGGDSAAPIFKDFMDTALAGVPNVGLPAPGPVCDREPMFVNEDGGRVAAPAPTPEPTVGPAPTPSPRLPVDPGPRRRGRR